MTSKMTDLKTELWTIKPAHIQVVRVHMDNMAAIMVWLGAESMQMNMKVVDGTTHVTFIGEDLGSITVKFGDYICIEENTGAIFPLTNAGLRDGFVPQEKGVDATFSPPVGDFTYEWEGDHLSQSVKHDDEPQSNLVDHARRELGYVGEEPETIAGYLKVIRAFADMGHSGGSASVAIPVINELLQFKNLTPLTDNPEEWEEHGPAKWDGTNGVWQNIRNGEAFSNDGGRTYYLLSNGSHAGFKFPLFKSESWPRESKDE